MDNGEIFDAGRNYQKHLLKVHELIMQAYGYSGPKSTLIYLGVLNAAEIELKSARSLFEEVHQGIVSSEIDSLQKLLEDRRSKLKEILEAKVGSGA